MSAVANHAATQICCPACASSHTTQLHQVEGSSFFWRRCPKCGLRFIEPMQAADSSWYEHSAIYRDLQVWQGAKPKAGVMYWNFRQALNAISGAGKRSEE